MKRCSLVFALALAALNVASVSACPRSFQILSDSIEQAQETPDADLGGSRETWYSLEMRARDGSGISVSCEHDKELCVWIEGQLRRRFARNENIITGEFRQTYVSENFIFGELRFDAGSIFEGASVTVTCRKAGLQSYLY